MKKLSIIGAIALVLATSACSKTQEPESGELVKVTFNVSTLDVYSEPMTKATAASSGLAVIDYIISDSAGNKKTGKQVKSSNPGEFGVISLWLTPGTYTAKIAGFDKNAEKSGLSDRMDDGIVLYTNNTDAFLYSSKLTIAADTNDYSIELARQTGKLVVDFTDMDIPDDIKGYSVSFTGVTAYNITKSQYYTSTKVAESVMVTNGAFPEFGYFMFDMVSMPVTINVLGANNAVMGSTSVNVDIVKNKRTIIRGNILDIITQKGLSITYDDEWGTDIIVPLQ